MMNGLSTMSIKSRSQHTCSQSSFCWISPLDIFFSAYRTSPSLSRTRSTEPKPPLPKKRMRVRSSRSTSQRRRGRTASMASATHCLQPTAISSSPSPMEPPNSLFSKPRINSPSNARHTAPRFPAQMVVSDTGSWPLPWQRSSERSPKKFERESSPSCRPSRDTETLPESMTYQSRACRTFACCGPSGTSWRGAGSGSSLSGQGR
mmetsp:Transcript_43253/g.108655  ORF Transcript_43253/g.108655 Transcript_43253/m.108655 type:complete len:205 (+) Transcript_43253:822-1436(+)